MRLDPAELIQTEDKRKGIAINHLRIEFSRAMLKRFYVIKDNIEDVWDLAVNQTALENRLRTLASKEVHTEKNLLDMGLLSCLLWNGQEDTEV